MPGGVFRRESRTYPLQTPRKPLAMRAHLSQPSVLMDTDNLRLFVMAAEAFALQPASFCPHDHE